ncbi:hypothetical protein D918_01896 [Trichuris suis]|nr:hypothetical protein D918_01896 [Trichuris suis]
MASRYGPRAVGTDGSDYRHRQRVASHYRDSAVNKYRLKITLIMHGLLLLLVAAKVFIETLQRLSLSPDSLSRIHLPSVNFWEYWWLCSFLALLTAMASIPKNDFVRIRRAYFLIVFLGLMPITVAAGLNVSQLMHYAKHGQAEEYFHGFPVVVLWYIFFTIAFQIHVFTMVFATKLGTAWQPAVKLQSKSNNNAPAQKLHES